MMRIQLSYSFSCVAIFSTVFRDVSAFSILETGLYRQEINLSKSGLSSTPPNIFLKSDSSLFSSTQKSTTTSDEIADSEVTTLPVNSADNNLNLICVSRPQVLYAVPSAPRAFRTEDEKWILENGDPLDGPPLNYWRQGADERDYSTHMNLVNDLLSTGNVEESVAAFKGRGVRYPMMNRKILSNWVRIVKDGKVAAVEKIVETGCASMIRDPSKYQLFVDETIKVFRTDGRKMGKLQPGYGTFDAHLEDGERVTLEGSGGSGGIVTAGASVDFAYSQVDGIGWGGKCYLSTYIAIFNETGEKKDGKVKEVWMKI